MAEYENLQVERSEGIETITISRPKVLNALNAATLGELDCAMTAARDSDEVGAVLLTGAGEKSFVAGADINELAKLGPLQAKQVARYGQEVFSRIEGLGKPVLAAVNGFALGGGLELACACTFRIASTNAVMGVPEVSLGIIPGYGGTQRLPRWIGMGRAMEMILTGDPLDAAEAHRVGLVNHVHELPELIPAARKLLGRILKRGPLAVKMAMEAAYRGQDMSVDDGLNLECNLFGLLTTTADMKEGMTAFLEKRKADFKGQ